MTSLVVDTFLDLVKIDSPSGHEEQVADYIQKFFERLGIEAAFDNYGNVICKTEGEGETIILSSHMDTVEPGRGIKPIVINGEIKSDGSTVLGADNKAWLAAILSSVANIKRSDRKPRSLDLIFTRQEESQDGGSTHLDLRTLRGKRGFSCDDGSPMGAIFFRSPYYIKIDIIVLGKAAHSAEPDKASNALKATSEAIYRLPLGDIGDKTIRNIGIINSGHGRNTIPGEVSLVAEIRSFSKQNLAKATTDMINLFRTIAKKHNCTIRKYVELENPGFELDLNDKTLQEAQMALKDIGIEPRLEETYGCFDANYFAARGIHIVNMSDGSVDTHTTGEKISVDNLEKLQKLAERLMTDN